MSMVQTMDEIIAEVRTILLPSVTKQTQELMETGVIEDTPEMKEWFIQATMDSMTDTFHAVSEALYNAYKRGYLAALSDIVDYADAINVDEVPNPWRVGG